MDFSHILSVYSNANKETGRTSICITFCNSEREKKNDNSHIAPSFLAHFILVHILEFLTIEGLL